MDRYRFALRPRWIVSHGLVLLLVVVMVNLGFWQLRRLDERRDFNRLVSDRSRAAEVAIADVLEPTATVDEAGGALYRRVVATGTYDSDREVLVRGRSQGGAPGAWVLTPLRTTGGVALVVNRGWVPASGPIDRPPAEAAAPAGEQTVEGILRESQRKGRWGPSDPGTGVLDTLTRADIGRYQEQVPYDLYPAWLQLANSDPARDQLPLPLPDIELTDGPHLGYAVQWFIFSTVAVAGYPIILRRRARE